MINKENLVVDFCVIGAGSGGLSFAAGAAKMGASVALLEGDKMGGDCLNYGCVPSKALIHTAKIAKDLSKANSYGFKFTMSGLDFKGINNYIQNVIKTIEPHDSVERFTGLGVNVIQEYGYFASPNTITTDSYSIKAKYFIIATGSKPLIPKIKGLSEVKFYTNETIFDMKELPKKMMIIGAGPIAIEIAQSLSRLGSEIHVLARSTILSKDDKEISNVLKRILEKEGVVIHVYSKINNIYQGDTGITCLFKNQDDNNIKLDSTHLLVATGRIANIDKLNLNAANVKFSERGIEVNSYLQTSNPNIYAIGDCIGKEQFTHAAGYYAGVAIRNCIFPFFKQSIDKAVIPRVTYTDPELAHVGVLEEELIRKKIKYKSITNQFANIDRAQTDNAKEGMIKILMTQRGKIVGVTILGKNAGDLIYPWILAINNNLNIKNIAQSIAPYPTFSDIHKQSAGKYYADFLFGPIMKKIVKFMLRLTK